MPASLRFKLEQEEKEINCAQLVTIGRTPPNDIIIPFPKISRNHAIIRMLTEGQHYIVDVGSTNGTYLNGKRVVMPAALKNQDVITVGDCAITFISDHDAKQKKEDVNADAATMASLGSKTEEITLLVCDIRNYTPISEHLPPDELASLMAEWFKMATKEIEKCHGTIDKFIGDAIMVRWSANIGAGSKSLIANALQAAKHLNNVCTHINASFPNLPHTFRIGIGINTGRAVLGNIGGSGYREYTAIGDAVNLAFRFETESKKLGKDIVVGPESYKHLPKVLWNGKYQSVEVKGKKEPVAVWAITFNELDHILAKLTEKTERIKSAC